MTERIERLLHKVPGYSGYRAKESRRDEDRRVREATADSLVGVVDALTRANADLVAQRQLTHVSRLENLTRQARLLSDRIRTATYGYGGLFSDRPVDEAVLGQIRQFDVALQREVDDLATTAGRVGGSGAGPDDELLATIEQRLSELSNLFDTRTEVVDTAAATRDEKVLNLLDDTPEPEPSPLMSVAVGDTLSVLGDNYVVEATVSLTGNDGAAQLARVGKDGEGRTVWIMGSKLAGIPSARLVELADAAAPGAAEMMPARASIASSQGRQDSAGARYAALSTDAGITLALEIGDQRWQMQGNEIRDIDVEIYGSA